MQLTDRVFQLAASAAFATLVASPALAQGYTHSPFHDRPVEVSQAATVVLMGVRGEAVLADPAELDEVVEWLQEDLLRIGQTLERLDADAYAALAASIDVLEDAVDDPALVQNAAEALKAAAARAEPLLVPEWDEPLRAAATAMWLRSEIGMGEAYEEAVEGDLWAYPYAYAMLQHIHVEMAGFTIPENLQQDVEDLMGRLDELMPTPTQPERLSSDPEEAEAYAEALIGVLEVASDSELYVARDLSRALGTIQDLVDAGCTEGGARSGIEMIAIAALYHEDVLEKPMRLLASGPQAAAEDLYDDMMDARAVTTEACAALVEALADMREAVFPGSAR